MADEEKAAPAPDPRPGMTRNPSLRRDPSTNKPDELSSKPPSRRGFNKELSSKGFVHDVFEISRADALDASENEVFYEDEWDEIENPVLRYLIAFLVFFKCLPEHRKNSTPVKNALRWLQWLSLLADVSAALVSIIQFNGVTFCCGTEILNGGSTNIPWSIIIRSLTYIYLVLIMTEIYPVIRKGFPFNIVNPCFGLIITIAMFFDDSKQEALIMWGIETLAVISEYMIYLLKVYQRRQLDKEIKRVGRLTRPKKDEDSEDSDDSDDSSDDDSSDDSSDSDDSDDSDLAEKEAKILRAHRQRYYQLKRERELDKKMIHFLSLACYMNFSFSFIVLILIIFLARAGGLCVSGYNLPNPFTVDQIAHCPLCANITGECEICTDEIRQCYFPYG